MLPNANSHPVIGEGDKKFAPKIAQSASTIEQWIKPGDHDDEGDPHTAASSERQGGHRSQRGGKRKGKNNSAKEEAKRDWDFDFNTYYNPEKPTDVEVYARSAEHTQALNDWKMKLYAHKMKGKPQPAPSSDEEKPFAPLPKYGFVPPPIYNSPNGEKNSSGNKQPGVAVSNANPEQDIPPTPSAPIPEEALSGVHVSAEPAYPFENGVASPGVSDNQTSPSLAQNEARPLQSQTVSMHMPLPDIIPAPGTGPTASGPHLPPPAYSATISAAPVRYSQPDGHQNAASPSNQISDPLGGVQVHASPIPDAPKDDPKNDPPSKKDFGKRMLEKHGWKQGEGLGASKNGIIDPLKHEPLKRKKRPNGEGGGWAGPSGMGRIVGGKKRRVEPNADSATEQKMSMVALFSNMLKGVNVQHEVANGTLMQDIGNAMEKFGIVERLYLDRDVPNELGGTRVFVKFTSPLSAYNAVNASNGKDFLRNGCTVQACFFDEERFEAGDYA